MNWSIYWMPFFWPNQVFNICWIIGHLFGYLKTYIVRKGLKYITSVRMLLNKGGRGDIPPLFCLMVKPGSLSWCISQNFGKNQLHKVTKHPHYWYPTSWSEKKNLSTCRPPTKKNTNSWHKKITKLLSSEALNPFFIWPSWKRLKTVENNWQCLNTVENN